MSGGHLFSVEGTLGGSFEVFFQFFGLGGDGSYINGLVVLVVIEIR